MTEVFKRSVSGGIGSRSWSQTCYVVERETDEPGVVAFARYSSRAAAEEDAARDGRTVGRTTRRWEFLDEDERPNRVPSWRL